MKRPKCQIPNVKVETSNLSCQLVDRSINRRVGIFILVSQVEGYDGDRAKDHTRTHAIETASVATGHVPHQACMQNYLFRIPYTAEVLKVGDNVLVSRGQ